MRRYSRLKMKVCDLVVDDWDRLADHIGLPLHDRARFRRGREPHGVWEWLELRERLGDLPEALTEIGRPDVAALLHAVEEGATARSARPRPAVLSAVDDPAAHFRLLDTAFFDLSEMREVIEDVLERGPGPAALVVTRPEEMVVVKLCEWLEHCVDDLQQRPAVSLNPLQGGLERALLHLEALRSVLAESSIVCRVNVQSPDVSAADILRFWSEVQHRFRDIDRWLLLLIQVHVAEVPLDGITSLPAPVFARAHIRAWVRALQIHLRWRQHVVPPLTEAVYGFAYTGAELDTRLVYEALGGVVDDIRRRPQWIHAELVKGTYIAHPAQN